MSKLGELTTTQIDQMMEGYKGYNGCFGCLELPSNIKEGVYIVNIDMVLNGPGTHWTLISNVEPKRVVYFDSFGTIPNTPTYTFIMKSGKALEYSGINYQNIYSSACGYYCVYVARRLLCGETIDDILDDFTYDTIDNERKLVKVFTKGNDSKGCFFQIDGCPKCYYHPSYSDSKERALKACKEFEKHKFNIKE